MGILEIGNIIIAIIGLIQFIMFIMLCVNVGEIKKYIRKIYIYEKTRMIEEGLIDYKTNTIKKWRFVENDIAVLREENTLNKPQDN